ncbi:DUF1176 domain-containing protein [Oricola nitratireducens]|uniref:DUF1176 domain-containing protein n=1 Tax=Oricola nitratireducens TaxID=2775868 RepID=UPI0018676302|nr:DUF1176 domain-containing protein [Oricola nitratireducens]
MNRAIASAAIFLVALAVPAGAQAQNASMTPQELLAAAKATYPGELCSWARVEENMDAAASWTLTFRYDYEKKDGPDRAVVLHQLPCFYGAYNFGSIWFMETEFEGLVPLHFAEPVLDIEYADGDDAVVEKLTVLGFSTTPTLIDGAFDQETQTISSFSKWRGLADAASSGTWTFREGAFVLTRYEVDATYDGESNPVTVYSAAGN